MVLINARARALRFAVALPPSAKAAADVLLLFFITQPALRARRDTASKSPARERKLPFFANNENHEDSLLGERKAAFESGINEFCRSRRRRRKAPLVSSGVSGVEPRSNQSQSVGPKNEVPGQTGREGGGQLDENLTCMRIP